MKIGFTSWKSIEVMQIGFVSEQRAALMVDISNRDVFG